MTQAVTISYDSGTVSSASGTTITLSAGTAVSAWVGRLFVIDRDNANRPGQFREITAVNSSTEIEISYPWRTSLDSSSPFYETLPQSGDTFHVSHEPDDIDDTINFEKVDALLYRNNAGLVLNGNITLWCKNITLDYGDAYVERQEGGGPNSLTPVNIKGGAGIIHGNLNRNQEATDGCLVLVDVSALNADSNLLLFAERNAVNNTLAFFGCSVAFTMVNEDPKITEIEYLQIYRSNLSGCIALRTQGNQYSYIEESALSGYRQGATTSRGLLAPVSGYGSLSNNIITDSQQTTLWYWPVAGTGDMRGIVARGLTDQLVASGNFNGNSTSQTLRLIAWEYDDSATNFIDWFNVVGGNKTIEWCFPLSITAQISGSLNGGGRLALYDSTDSEVYNELSSDGTYPEAILVERFFEQPGSVGTVAFSAGTQRAPYTGRFREYGIRFIEQTFQPTNPLSPVEVSFTWFKTTNEFTTAADSATALAVTNPTTANQIYDHSQATYAQSGNMQYDPLITTQDGVTLTFDLDVTLDSAATSESYDFANDAATFVNVTDGTFSTLQLGANHTLTLSDYSAYASSSWSIPATGTVNVDSCPSAVDLSNWTFADGASLEITDGGSVTITVASQAVADQLEADKTETSGTITFSAPVISFSASNIADGARVYLAHRQVFTIAAADITTANNIITLGNDSNSDAPAFASSSPYTLVSLSQTAGATLPTTSPQIVDGGRYYATISGSDITLFTKESDISGSPITISAAGTDSGGSIFTLIAETQLYNAVVSGGSGVSTSLALSDGAAIVRKAIHWDNSGTTTATPLYIATFAWSTSGGVTDPQSVDAAIETDAVHESIIAATAINFPGPIKNASGTAVTSLTPTNDGSLLDTSNSGPFAIILEGGEGQLQVNAADADGLALWQDFYAWGVFVSSTEAGIRLVNADTFTAVDIFNFITSNLTFDNTSSTELNLVGGVGRSLDGSTLKADTQTGSGGINFNALSQGVGATVETGTSGLTAGESATLAKLDDLTEDDGGIFRFTANALEQAPSGGSSLTQQQVRDALKLAPSAGAAASGSIDAQLTDIPTVSEFNARTLPTADYFDASTDAVTLAADAVNAGALAADAIAEIYATVDAALADYGANTTTPPTAAAIRAEIDANSTQLAAILTDTGTTLPAQISGLNDLAIADVETALSNYDAPVYATLQTYGDANWATATGFAVSGDIPTADITAIKAKTDQITFTVANQVDANALTGGGGDDAATIYSYFTGLSRADAFKADVSGLSTFDGDLSGIPAAVWGYSGRALDGSQATAISLISTVNTNVASCLSAAEAVTDGRFVNNYTASTATQYNTDGTIRTVFDLLDANGDPATSAQTAIERRPQ